MSARSYAAVALVCATVSLGGLPARAQPTPRPEGPRPRPAQLDGIVRGVDYGAQTVTLESNGRLIVVNVPGTTPIKAGTQSRTIVDFKRNVTRLHVEGSAVGENVTASSIDIRR